MSSYNPAPVCTQLQSTPFGYSFLLEGLQVFLCFIQLQHCFHSCNLVVRFRLGLFVQVCTYSLSTSFIFPVCSSFRISFPHSNLHLLHFPHHPSKWFPSPIFGSISESSLVSVGYIINCSTILLVAELLYCCSVVLTSPSGIFSLASVSLDILLKNDFTVLFFLNFGVSGILLGFVDPTATAATTFVD